jgi:hypothetical protein
MKKTYISPEMEVIEIKSQQTLLAGSVNMYGENADGEAMAPEHEWYEWRF